MKAIAPIVMAAAVAACGAAPNAPAPVPLLPLEAGPHTLSVSIAQTIVTNPIGITSSITVCAGSGPGSIALPVDLAREGDVWVARAQSGDLVLRLLETSGSIYGTLRGRSTQGSVTLNVVGESPWEPALLSATLAGAGGVGGQIAGSVSFDTAQSSQSCSSNSWSMRRR